MVIEFKKTEQYIRDLQALRLFDTVKKENEEMKEKLGAQAKKIQELELCLKDYEEAKRKLDEVAKSLPLVEKNGLSVIDQVILDLSKDPNPASFSSIASRGGLHEKVADILEKEVRKRLDTRFKREIIATYRAEVERQVNSLSSRWHQGYLGSQTEAKMQILRKQVGSNPFIVLQRGWQIACDRCGIHSLDLDPVKIERLLTEGYLRVESGSLTSGLFGRHEVKVTLSDIVYEYLVSQLFYDENKKS